MAILAKDSFTPPPDLFVDIDQSVLDVGSVWNAIRGQIFISDVLEACYPEALDGPLLHAVYDTLITPSNYTVKCTLDPAEFSPVAGVLRFAGLCARRKTLNTVDNYYAAVAEIDGDNPNVLYTRLYRVVEGVITTLATSGSVGFGVGELKFTLNGKTLRVFWNNIRTININNASLTSGNAGLVSNADNIFGLRSNPPWDNFQVDGTGVPAPPPPPPPVTGGFQFSVSSNTIELNQKVMTLHNDKSAFFPFPIR